MSVGSLHTQSQKDIQVSVVNSLPSLSAGLFHIYSKFPTFSELNSLPFLTAGSFPVVNLLSY